MNREFVVFAYRMRVVDSTLILRQGMTLHEAQVFQHHEKTNTKNPVICYEIACYTRSGLSFIY